jgi:hypothetical protein
MMPASKNRSQSDCGIVAVSAASGLSYARVRREWGEAVRGGIGWHDMISLSQDCGLSPSIMRTKAETLDDFVRMHQRGRFIAHVQALFDAHWVAVVDGRTINAEGIGYWKLMRVLRVEAK